MNDHMEEATNLLFALWARTEGSSQENDAEDILLITAALSAAHESGRQEAFGQSIKICEHAIEHYKGPVADKILREIRVAAIRKDQP